MIRIKKKTTSFKRIVEKKIIAWHFLSDLLVLVVCHILFLSKYKLPYYDLFSPLVPLREHLSIPLAILMIVIIWLFAFYISGHYNNPARKSGLQTIGPTAATCFMVSILLLLIVENYAPVELTIKPISLSFHYFFFVFISVFSFRMIIIWRLHYLLNKGKTAYKKVLIGNNQQALETLKRHPNPHILKHEYIGYIPEDEKYGYNMTDFLPCLGKLSNIEKLVMKKDVDEATVCLNHSQPHTINQVINILKQKDILIRLSTNLHPMLDGTIKTQNLESSPFITISNHKMPVWQNMTKKILDLALAWVSLIVTTPILIAIAVAIKIDSKGPIIYRQERIGKNKKPFIIYKFRSMYVNAEENGPALSYQNDPRITKVGNVIRKWRLDELPQLINVIIGNMSFVGPRPEREYYVNKILRKAPYYALLLKIKPGITSWGIVKFGYARNVDEMIKRLKYDILYLENRTLVVDLKILLYSLKTLIKGKGI
ncbi:sugar transferase [Saccharicrinis fermentans]|nr:sugar transferase [Saccharicrinis fermentans]